MNEYSFNELTVGMECEFSHSFSIEQLEIFSKLSGDNNPLHTDIEFAKAHGYESCVVFGMLTASLLSTLGGVYLPGKNCLIQGVDISFSRPVYPMDEILVKGKIVEIFESVGQVVIRVDMYNQKKEKVLRGKMKVGMING